MKKVGIIVNTQKTDNVSYMTNVKKVIDYLADSAELYMERQFEGLSEKVGYFSYSELLAVSEYMIVMGGDGTIIRVSGDCARRSIPVLGINLGRIGFMTEVEPNAIEDALDKFVSDDYKTEKRIMIKAEVRRDGKKTDTFHALNDIVVSKADGVKLLCLDLYTDGELVNRYIADGLIIATPTGSTGYSISAGGPVADPSMDLFLATPICAHMLSARSAVLSSDKELLIKEDENYGSFKAIVTADGETKCEIDTSCEVVITRSQYALELIKIGSQSFYDTLIKKLS
ncbi:MAG: NAD(+)/NADH kinase [Firmicutes bacterium]|nr:NAD(+)/NADH kinase [Bacillota bacterium]